MSNTAAIICAVILFVVAYFGLDYIQKKPKGKATHAEWAAGELKKAADKAKAAVDEAKK